MAESRRDEKEEKEKEIKICVKAAIPTTLVLKSPLEARLGMPLREATRSAPRRG